MSLSFPFLIGLSLFIAFLEPNLLSNLKDLIPFFLGLIMFGMGMTLDLNDLKKVFLKPNWIITGLLIQYIVMPLTAFLLAFFLEVGNELLLGFVILGSCPGGTASNVIAYLAKANLPLSISLTIISTILSVFLTPFWIYILADQSISVNFLDLMSSTFWIVIFPLADGLILRKILKNRLSPFIKFFPKVSELFIAIIIGIIFSLSHDSFEKISFLLFIVVIAHNLIGLLVGYFVPLALGFPLAVRKAIAIEIGMQNSGLGMTLSILHFSKIVALPSVIFSLWHNLSSLILIGFWSKKKKLNFVRKF